jgi:DNA-binding IclR family transcriptional regulator
MLAAQRSGESVRHIAEWAGMSTTTAQRLLDEAKRREREG